MLELRQYFTALKNMRATVQNLAEFFNVSIGSISNWTSGARIPNKNLEELVEGTEKCRDYLHQDEETFICGLVHHMGLSPRETGILEMIYSKMEYQKFLRFLIQKCADNEDILPNDLQYDPRSMIRPVIGAGQQHVLAVKSNGKIMSAGSNNEQQCDIHLWQDVVSVAASWRGTIALMANGTCIVTGKNMIGSGEVFGWRDIVSVTCGTYHVLGLKADGTVVAYGRAGAGQCAVENWENITAIAAGHNHSVGLKSDGTVVAVGKNNYGQCDIQEWRDIIQIAADGDHTLGLDLHGTVYATGDVELFRVKEWKDIKAIATGNFHAIGLKADGTVVNTGHTASGQDGVERWHDIIAISAGYNTSIGVRVDGKVYCTNDEHSDIYFNPEDWKLFDGDTSSIMSNYDQTLENFFSKLTKVKKTVMQCSPHATQFHDYNEAFEYLYFLSKDIWGMHDELDSMPTIDEMVMTYSAAYVDFMNTVTKTESGTSVSYQLTKASYNAFVKYLNVVNNLLREARMKE